MPLESTVADFPESSAYKIWQRFETNRFLFWIVWSILYFVIISVLSAHKLIWKDEFFTYISLD